MHKCQIFVIVVSVFNMGRRFPPEKFCEFPRWRFVKFSSTPLQITVSTVNSAVNQSTERENQLCCSKYPTYCHLLVLITGAALDRKKHFPLYNLPPKMAAAFHGLITNAGLMAAGMSYSFSSQKQTTSLYLYI